MKTILVTCVGSGVGQSAIDSLNLLRQFNVIGCDMKRNVYANNFCDTFYIVPSIYSDEYIDFILNLCMDNKIDVIIPGHDHELGLLSKNIFKFQKKNIAVIVSKPDLIDISRDKYEWYHYFIKYNCPIVPTYKVKEFRKDPDTSIFPAITKPSGGSSSQGILIINSIEDLNAANDSDIIQPYLFPNKNDKNYDLISKVVSQGTFVQMSEVSIQLVFTKESKLAGIFISKNTLRGGIPIFIDPIPVDEFEYIDDIMKFVPICIENKVTGPVNIQGRITEKGLLCFEMNMRFTGITGNRAQLGFNEVVFLVNDALGVPSKLDGYSSNKLGVREVACTTIPRLQVENKTYTVLGAGGCIGSHFVQSLIKSGKYQIIYIISRESSYERYKSFFSASNIQVLSEGDQFVETAMCQSDVLINFIGALAFEADIEKFNAITFQYQQVQKIIKANIPLVINISSQSVYDQKSNMKKDERANTEINNLYIFQKYITEKFFESIKLFSPLSQTVSLRLSRVIGTDVLDSKPTGFFANVIQSLNDNKIINIPNPSNNTNLLDVRDAINAISHIIQISTNKSLPKVINVGGTNITIKDYCNKVLKTLELESKKDLIVYADNTKVSESSMISSRLMKNYGWSNQYTLEKTIKHMSDKLL